jgi:hypothetical protein
VSSTHFEALYADQDVKLPVEAPEEVKITFPLVWRRCGSAILRMETSEKKLMSNRDYNGVNDVNETVSMVDLFAFTFIWDISMCSMRSCGSTMPLSTKSVDSDAIIA